MRCPFSRSRTFMTLPFFITAPLGTEDLVAREAEQYGAAEVKVTRAGVRVEAETAFIYRFCLNSRVASRLLFRLGEYDVNSADSLHAAAKQIDWQQHMHADATIAVHFDGTNDWMRNTQFGAQTVKDAVVDYMRDAGLPRPNVDKTHPDLRIHAYLYRDRISLAIDLSGPLHMRGYRDKAGKAPMRETLAAAMLMRGNWQASDDQPLVDPMCGSGTILIEAAMMAANVGPGLLRDFFPFQRWPLANQNEWKSVRDEAEIKAKEGRATTGKRFFGLDLDRSVLGLAKDNAHAAGVGHLINFAYGDIADLTNKYGAQGTVISNPPYGERLGTLAEVLALHYQFGTQLKAHFGDWRALIYNIDGSLLNQLRMRADKRHTLYNGQLKGTLASYQISSSEPKPIAEDFINRVKKNMKRLNKWIKQSDTDCYRVYDRDLPEYNLAIDFYGDWVIVQEFAAPKTIDEKKAQNRLNDALVALADLPQVDSRQIALKTRMRQRGAQQYERQQQANVWFKVNEGQCRFWINPLDYLDTGLFLDHRTVRMELGAMAEGQRVLNLFCYTGTATCHAAKGGATSSVSVDMSRTYLDWAARNFELNGMDPKQHQLIKADCMKWLVSTSDRFDLIFIDPPSFSNSKKMEGHFDVQRDHVELLAYARELLTPGGVIVFSNNLRGFKLDSEKLAKYDLSIQDVTEASLPEDFKRNQRIHHCFLLECER
ncbi:bifunctional 23S rRNA (guanine(2069)-N(7))-methyltransferase RlmK/23S rRNA (guanine(2445)-N(2))-methyltransferase RlmL [Corallincola spongiicola]|uniref:Ribosomal RNA large subunit methyltransferase K/L n=2 Tax=Corallincola spongiicola TaxID=2520508 RepID=A0ABY1WTS9_9GAMM|nr:bifunctional 23S rRNA (guanine(2069)-N(7))-methyltransferase RlmK/23S rRNA (guanine(2445)-N(2))-methyltransferase RlmL [Corallincola spongiicola]